MIPPDTSMPAYESPMSIWPGIITLAIGILLLTYLIVRVIRDYRRTHAELAAAAMPQKKNESVNSTTTDTPTS